MQRLYTLHDELLGVLEAYIIAIAAYLGVVGKYSFSTREKRRDEEEDIEDR